MRQALALLINFFLATVIFPLSICPMNENSGSLPRLKREKKDYLDGLPGLQGAIFFTILIELYQAMFVVVFMSNSNIKKRSFSNILEPYVSFFRSNLAVGYLHISDARLSDCSYFPSDIF